MVTDTRNILDEVRIYVGTYAKYNNGSLAGAWLTLGDYDSIGDFYDACKELHKDETDPEYMFQDYEVPEELEGAVTESNISETIFEDAETIDTLLNLDDCEWLQIQSEFDPGSALYEFDDDFFDNYFCNRPTEAARAASFGDINWVDDYIYFNAYGNLETTSDIWDVLDKKELIQYYKDNKNDFCF